MEIEGVTKKRRRMVCKHRKVCGWKKIKNEKDFKVWESQNKQKQVGVYRNLFIISTKRGFPRRFRKENMGSAFKSAKSYMKKHNKC